MSGKQIEYKTSTLQDRFGRIHDYLRLSITDNCNFACTYCRPDNKVCDLSHSLMNTDEIVQIAKAFSVLGIKKIRLTGGEPLLHNNFENIVHELSKLPLNLAVTTNGFLLDKFFNTLIGCNVKNLNISLDTLKPERFKSITHRNAFHRVFANLILAIKLGFNVKLNAVIMQGTNEDEIFNFAQLTKRYPITVRFIEFMPFKDNDWNFGKTFSRKSMIERLSEEYDLILEKKAENQTAEYVKIPGAKGKIGIISTLSQPFCDSCNRLRVMADGKLKNCLFGKNEVDLITPYREGKNLQEVIEQSLLNKHAMHGGNKSIGSESVDYSDNRNMYSIGG